MVSSVLAPLAATCPSQQSKQLPWEGLHLLVHVLAPERAPRLVQASLLLVFVPRSHVLGSRHLMFRFCLMSRFVGRLLSHKTFRHVAGEIQTFPFGIQRFSFWWLRFMSEQQLKRGESSTLEYTIVSCASRVQTLGACTRPFFIHGIHWSRSLH